MGDGGLSPVGPSSANSHLTTSTNIFNELQPQVSAPIHAKICQIPGSIVTRLSQKFASFIMANIHDSGEFGVTPHYNRNKKRSRNGEAGCLMNWSIIMIE